jgi:hypothetical protein
MIPRKMPVETRGPLTWGAQLVNFAAEVSSLRPQVIEIRKYNGIYVCEGIAAALLEGYVVKRRAPDAIGSIVVISAHALRNGVRSNHEAGDFLRRVELLSLSDYLELVNAFTLTDFCLKESAEMDQGIVPQERPI